MLVINSASVNGIGYWQATAVHTRWLGQGAKGLGLGGAVADDDLAALLRGRSPDGQNLTARPGLRRRQGWDLVIAAPKSLSMLTVTAGPAAPRPVKAPEAIKAPGPVKAPVAAEAPVAVEVLVRCYRSAVADAVELLEKRAAFVVSGGRLQAAPAVAAAGFEHRASDAGQPHLHTHVVLANLAHPGGPYWGCLVGREIWRWREATGAAFQMALRDHLRQAGFSFEWEVRPGGLAEIAAVPGRARSAASTRSRAVAAQATAFGSGSRAAARMAQATSRREVPQSPPGTSNRPGTPGKVGALSRAGALGQPPAPGEPPGHATEEWGNQKAVALLARVFRPGGPCSAGPAPEAAAVAEALANRASTFNEADVLVALAEETPQGLPLAQAMHWGRDWYARARPVAAGPGKGPRKPGERTTPQAAAIAARTVEMAVEGRSAHLAQVSPDLAQRELAELGTPAPLVEAALHLACAGEAVSIVPRASWLDQAACVDAARSVWQAGGVTVQLATPTELSARRWHALTSLVPPQWAPGRPAEAGAAGLWRPRAGQPGRRALVVDAADHLSPLALERLVARAAAARTKLVLVMGGPLPGPERSLAGALDRLAENEVPAALAALAAPGREGTVSPALVAHLAAAPVPGRHGPLVRTPDSHVSGALSGPACLAQVVALATAPARWPSAPPDAAGGGPGPGPSAPYVLPRGARGQGPPLMVAYGPAEAELLNGAARTARTAEAGRRGYDTRPHQVRLGDRWYAAGDEVMALRRLGQASAATRGSVLEVAPGHLVVQWRGRRGEWQGQVSGAEAASLGYGYATTVPYLRGTQAGDGLVVLGDPTYLSPGHHWQGACVTLSGSGLPSFGRPGREARERAGQWELTERWPARQLGSPVADGPGAAWWDERARAPRTGRAAPPPSAEGPAAGQWAGPGRSGRNGLPARPV